jgi:hypothetical protein
MIKRYKLFSCQCGCGAIDYAESTKGNWVKYEDIEKIFNEFQIPQIGDDYYIDGVCKAYEQLNKAIFG